MFCAACTSPSAGTAVEPSTSGSSSTSTTPPTTSTTTTAPATSSAPTATAGPAQGSVTVGRTLATGIRVPWGLARLPDGRFLVSARDSYQILSVNLGSGATTLLGTVAGAVSNVSQAGDGGLLGIAVSPTFTDDRLVYVYFSTTSDNRVATVTYDPSRPEGQQVGSPQVLYATTGEAENPALAQDKGSLGGKILRMTTTGKPRRTTRSGRWCGRSAIATSRASPGTRPAGCGRRSSATSWPTSSTKSSRARTTAGRRPKAAPHRPGTRARSLNGAPTRTRRAASRTRIPVNGTEVVADPQPFLHSSGAAPVGELGRLRSVLAVDDRTLLVTTSNRDGRTTPRTGDDRLVVLSVIQPRPSTGSETRVRALGSFPDGPRVRAWSGSRPAA